jgi:hypothetical protein
LAQKALIKRTRKIKILLIMSKEYKITEQGSLGLLALGHIGLRKWREVVAEEKKKRQEKKNDKKEK